MDQKAQSVRHETTELRKNRDGTMQVVFHGKRNQVSVPIDPKAFTRWCMRHLRAEAFL